MSAATLVIRDATPDDLPVIVDFNAQLAWESESRRLDLPTLTSGVRRALESPSLCRYFVAERAGTIVGQTMLTFELTDWRDGVLWWIQSVYVLPDHRRCGVFAALFAHIQNLAETDPTVRGLRLYVEEHNQRAQATYAKMGLAPTGHLLYERDWSGKVT